jgi:hypothetical protein
VKQPNIPVRLVSTSPGLDFLGRVEVYHNNQWGTVCDDYSDRYMLPMWFAKCLISQTEFCVMEVHSYIFGQGTGIQLILYYMK